MPAPPPPSNQVQQERRRHIRGLLLLAFAILIFSFTRAGWHRVFTHGWWRLW
jgi:hypothetical protein